MGDFLLATSTLIYLLTQIKLIALKTFQKNLKILVRLINSVSDVVYAWGNNTDEPNFLKQIVDSPMCLGKNKDGSPSHPLYLPSNSKLLKFR